MQLYIFLYFPNYLLFSFFSFYFLLFSRFYIFLYFYVIFPLLFLFLTFISKFPCFILYSFLNLSFLYQSKGGAPARRYSNEAALSLRSRRSGTKFAEPLQVRSLSADVFQGASFGIPPCLRWFVGYSTF